MCHKMGEAELMFFMSDDLLQIQTNMFCCDCGKLCNSTTLCTCIPFATQPPTSCLSLFKGKLTSLLSMYHFYVRAFY